jgi:Holliday junction resolvase-like predicted endonuclease
MNFGLRRHNKVLEELCSRVQFYYRNQKNYKIEKNYFYKEGELDLLVRNQYEDIISIYEVKGRHSTKGLFKAHKQLTRAGLFYEKRQGFMPKLVYVSKYGKCRDWFAKRMYR